MIDSKKLLKEILKKQQQVGSNSRAKIKVSNRNLQLEAVEYSYIDVYHQAAEHIKQQIVTKP